MKTVFIASDNTVGSRSPNIVDCSLVADGFCTVDGSVSSNCYYYYYFEVEHLVDVEQFLLRLVDYVLLKGVDFGYSEYFEYFDHFDRYFVLVDTDFAAFLVDSYFEYSLGIEYCSLVGNYLSYFGSDLQSLCFVRCSIDSVYPLSGDSGSSVVCSVDFEVDFVSDFGYDSEPGCYLDPRKPDHGDFADYSVLDFDYYPGPVPEPDYFPDSAHHFDHPNSVLVDCLAYSYYLRIAATCYQRSSHNVLVAVVAAVAAASDIVVGAEPESEPDAISAAVVATARVYKRHRRNLGSQARSGFDLCNLTVDWVFFEVVDLVGTCWLVDYCGCFVGSGYFVGRFDWFDCRSRCFG
jgi:hypothetical protein